MEKVSRILFPVDLSDISSKMAPEVITMARKFDAEIHLLFVSGSLEQYSTFYIPHPSLDKMEDDIQRGAERKLKEFKEEYFAGYGDTKARVLRGDPAEEILKYIQTEKIDMVILPTHGRKGLDRIIFGGVAERVVKMSPVPVLSINPHRKA